MLFLRNDNCFDTNTKEIPSAVQKHGTDEHCSFSNPFAIEKSLIKKKSEHKSRFCQIPIKIRDIFHYNSSLQESITYKSPSTMKCGPSVHYYKFLERLLLVVKESNGNPTCSLLASPPIRSDVVIRRPFLESPGTFRAHFG